MTESISIVPASTFVPNPSETQTSEPNVEKPPIGAIAGGIIGILLLIIGMLAALFWRRRRRLNRMGTELSPHPYSATMTANGSVSFGGTRKAQNQQGSKGIASGATSTSAAASSLPPDIPTSELAWALYHRMQNQDFAGAPPPPGYV